MVFTEDGLKVRLTAYGGDAEGSGRADDPVLIGPEPPLCEREALTARPTRKLGAQRCARPAPREKRQKRDRNDVA